MLEQKAIAQSILDSFSRAEDPLDCQPGSLALSYKGKKIVPDVRLFSDLVPVLLFPEAIRPSMKNSYYMYRAVDEKGKIRYDVTVIPGTKIGYEFNKTLGHYHPIANSEKSLSYPEIYQVLHGHASYVLQKKDYSSGDPKEILVIEAKQGDIVCIMPNWGHVTVNPRSDLLIMSNIVDCSFSSDYQPYIENKGAAVFITTEGIVRNQNYPKELPVSKTIGSEHEKHIAKKLFGKENDILHTMLFNPEKLGFLSNPV